MVNRRQSGRNKQTSVTTEPEQLAVRTDDSGIRFADVEDALSPFTGDNDCTVAKWVNDFEDIAELCRWSDLKMFIYGRKLLRGTAAAFIHSESNIRSWDDLRDKLFSEFQSRLTVADIHRMLSAIVKQDDETLLQFFYRVRELAKQGMVPDDSLIEYVIGGIPDAIENKTILYGATTTDDFKLKLGLYERMHRQRAIENSKYAARTARPATVPEVRCYNCGMRGHQSRDCPDASRGPKCFQCRSYGHKAFDCPTRREGQRNERRQPADSANAYQVHSSHDNGRIIKSVCVLGQEIMALIDTGCDLNLCRSSVLSKIGDVSSVAARVRLGGPAGACFYTERHFWIDLSVDGGTYTVDMYTVPDDTIGYDVVLGRSLFQTSATLLVSPQSVTIVNASVEAQLMAIETCDLELDIGDRAYRKTIQKLVDSYCPDQHVTTPLKTVIVLTDEVPVYQRPRRLAPSEQVAVDEQVDEWLRDKIIRPSCSDYASPVVLVRKRDGSLRLCIDYRALNKKVIRDRYPLPLIDDQVDRLRGAAVFSTLDLRNGFFHVPVEESSIKYTAFVTPKGQYEFLRTPFGLCISPPVFQRYINFVFRDLIRSGQLLAYMDDLVVVASDLDEGMSRLKTVMNVAARSGLQIKWSKCQFLKRSIDYLGYHICYNSVRPSEEKIEAVKHFPLPSNAKSVQSFLGLTGYFRRFVHNYSLIAKPLSDLLKQGAVFRIGMEQEAAVNQLKKCLTEAPVLQIYYQEASVTELHTDASMWGYGAVLLQISDQDAQLHPLCFMSRKTTEAQQKYHSYELEVLAIVEAVKKFRVHLLGLQFKIITDCAAFTRTLEKKDLATRVARWALLLSEYDYSIEHRAGSRMPHVDSLSRYPMCMVVQSELLARLSVAQRNDPEIQAVVPDGDEYVSYSGLLYKVCDGKNLLVVPKGMQTEIIRNAHDVGHFGIVKTEALVKQDYFMTGIKDKITNVLQNCVPCNE